MASLFYLSYLPFDIIMLSPTNIEACPVLPSFKTDTFHPRHIAISFDSSFAPTNMPLLQI